MSTDSESLGLWLKGLLAAVVSGGASSVCSAFGVNLIDAEHFNLSVGLHHLLTLMGVTFSINAIMGAMFYLKRSPIPNPPPTWDGATERRGNGPGTTDVPSTPSK